MFTKYMVFDSSANIIQAFPLTQGGINLTFADGAKQGVMLMHCVENGEIKITWRDSSEDTIVCITGEDFALPAKTVDSVIVISGTFHFA